VAQSVTRLRYKSVSRLANSITDETSASRIAVGIDECAKAGAVLF
jgi:hypothetical protein